MLAYNIYYLHIHVYSKWEVQSIHENTTICNSMILFVYFIVPDLYFPFTLNNELYKYNIDHSVFGILLKSLFKQFDNMQQLSYCSCCKAFLYCFKSLRIYKYNNCLYNKKKIIIVLIYFYKDWFLKTKDIYKHVYK